MTWLETFLSPDDAIVERARESAAWETVLDQASDDGKVAFDEVLLPGIVNAVLRALREKAVREKAVREKAVREKAGIENRCEPIWDDAVKALRGVRRDVGTDVFRASLTEVLFSASGVAADWLEQNKPRK
jgi:hypothetical protein